MPSIVPFLLSPASACSLGFPEPIYDIPGWGHAVWPLGQGGCVHLTGVHFLSHKDKSLVGCIIIPLDEVTLVSH